MGKNKNGRRSTGKNKKKETFKKYGKNTARGVRIKQTEMENKEMKNKWKKQNNNLVSFHRKCAQTKGKHGASTARSVCKITCKNKTTFKKS